jgi:hypothetical protein
VKVDALVGLLQHRARLKIFVATEGFCLCGYASKPLATEAGVLLEIGASVRFVFAGGVLLEEAQRSGTLLLPHSGKVTRRVQTHRRHLAGKEVPEKYFDLAMAL